MVPHSKSDMTSIPIPSYHGMETSYHSMSYHTIPCHTMPYPTIPYHHTIPYHTIIPYHTQYFTLLHGFWQIPLESHRMVGMYNSCGFPWIPSGIPGKFHGNSRIIPMDSQWNLNGIPVDSWWNSREIPWKFHSDSRMIPSGI